MPVGAVDEADYSCLRPSLPADAGIKTNSGSIPSGFPLLTPPSSSHGCRRRRQIAGCARLSAAKSRPALSACVQRSCQLMGRGSGRLKHDEIRLRGPVRLPAEQWFSFCGLSMSCVSATIKILIPRFRQITLYKGLAIPAAPRTAPALIFLQATCLSPYSVQLVSQIAVFAAFAVSPLACA